MRSLAGEPVPKAALMQLAWPVHVPLLSEPAAGSPPTPFSDIRGKAVAAVGNSWHFQYRLFPDVGLRAPRPISEQLRPKLLAALRGGPALWNGTAPDKDYYYYDD